MDQMEADVVMITYRRKHTIEKSEPVAVKDEVYGLLKSGEMVHDMTPMGLDVMDIEWPEVELLCPAGSAIEPSDAIMGRDVDHDESILDRARVEVGLLQGELEVMYLSLWTCTEKLPMLKDMLDRSGLRTTVMVQPDHGMRAVYLLLKGVDRDASCMLLDGMKWLERCHFLSDWGRYAWKVKHVNH